MHNILMVKNLPASATANTLNELFSKYGEVSKVKIVANKTRAIGSPTVSFGVVVMGSTAMALVCKEQLHNKPVLLNTRVQVLFCPERLIEALKLKGEMQRETTSAASATSHCSNNLTVEEDVSTFDASPISVTEPLNKENIQPARVNTPKEDQRSFSAQLQSSPHELLESDQAQQHTLVSRISSNQSTCSGIIEPESTAMQPVAERHHDTLVCNFDKGVTSLDMAPPFTPRQQVSESDSTDSQSASPQMRKRVAAAVSPSHDTSTNKAKRSRGRCSAPSLTPLSVEESSKPELNSPTKVTSEDNVLHFWWDLKKREPTAFLEFRKLHKELKQQKKISMQLSTQVEKMLAERDAEKRDAENEKEFACENIRKNLEEVITSQDAELREASSMLRQIEERVSGLETSLDESMNQNIVLSQRADLAEQSSEGLAAQLASAMAELTAEGKLRELLNTNLTNLRQEMETLMSTKATLEHECKVERQRLVDATENSRKEAAAQQKVAESEAHRLLTIEKHAVGSLMRQNESLEKQLQDCEVARQKVLAELTSHFDSVRLKFEQRCHVSTATDSAKQRSLGVQVSAARRTVATRTTCFSTQSVDCQTDEEPIIPPTVPPEQIDFTTNTEPDVLVYQLQRRGQLIFREFEDYINLLRNHTSI